MKVLPRPVSCRTRLHSAAALRQEQSPQVSRSLTIHEPRSLNERAKAVEAAIDLALCYWRERAFNAARTTLQDALSCLPDEQNDLRAAALVYCAMVEAAVARYDESSRFLTEAAPLLRASRDYILRGKFHNQQAIMMWGRGRSEQRREYLERALEEYAAAISYFKHAGNARLEAHIENNLGLLYFELAKLDEAHQHLERARKLLMNIKDRGSLAQVNESLARVLLTQGRTAQAEELIRNAVKVLEQGERQAALAEALTTQGVTLARLGQKDEAFEAHKRAIEIAAQASLRPPVPIDSPIVKRVLILKRLRKLWKK